MAWVRPSIHNNPSADSDPFLHLSNPLQKMKDDTTKLRSDSRANPSQLRIRDNLTNTLTRKFVDVMKDYQNAQTKYKAFIKNKVQRQVQIVKPDASPGTCIRADVNWG